jgi:hypothetical protein
MISMLPNTRLHTDHYTEPKDLKLSTHCKNSPRELGVVAHTCNPSIQKAEVGGLGVWTSLAYLTRPYLKKSKQGKK